MTRKDYVLIASAFRVLRQEARRNDAAYELCNKLQQDNPRFDRKKFLDACGVESEEDI